MSRRMLRHEIKVNDRPQVIEVDGDVLHVAAAVTRGEYGSEHFVEFWAEGTPGEAATPRTFQVFGTGHPLPEGAAWRGTTARTPQGLVWHLYELTKGA